MNGHGDTLIGIPLGCGWDSCRRSAFLDSFLVSFLVPLLVLAGLIPAFLVSTLPTKILQVQLKGNQRVDTKEKGEY
jgi:hypothetical protein